MKIPRLFFLLFGMTALSDVLLAANRTLTITAPAVVAPGQTFNIPTSASTDQGSNGEQIGFFLEYYSIDNGVTWTAVCSDANVGTSANRTVAITAGASGTIIVVKVEIAYRSGTAGDVDFTGGAINWAGSWTNWDSPPAKYAYIMVNNVASGAVIVPSTTYNAGQPAVVASTSTIATGTATTGNTVIVTSGAAVIYQAGTSINLKPGFQVQPGGKFNAQIAAIQPAPILLSSSTTSIIAGQSVTFSVVGGLGSVNYVWGGSASGTGTSQTLTFNTAGTYTVTVSNSSSTGLAQTTTMTITVYANTSSGYIDPGLKILTPTS